MKPDTWVLLGISGTGLVIGYMIGGSGTPVVAAVLPLIFGILVSGFALFRPRSLNASEIELLKLVENSEYAREIAEGIFKKSQSHLTLFGIGLLMFSISYGTGTIVGTKARVDRWFSGGQSGPISSTQIEAYFPWENSAAPNSLDEAVSWLELRIILAKSGFTREQIVQFYSAIHDVNNDSGPITTSTGSESQLLPTNRIPPNYRMGAASGLYSERLNPSNYNCVLSANTLNCYDRPDIPVINPFNSGAPENSIDLYRPFMQEIPTQNPNILHNPQHIPIDQNQIPVDDSGTN